MKNKILALFLAMTMVATMAMGMGNVAQAAGNYSITIQENNQNTEVHTFEAYQIFTGSLDAKTNTLGDIQWGANVNVSDSKKLTYKDVPYGADDAAKLAEVLSKEKDARDFATVVEAFITGAPAATATEAEAGKGCTISGLADGYYFVKDVTDLKNKNDTNSKIIVSIAGNNVSVNQKNETVSIDKTVMDINDSDAQDPTNNQYKNTSDWDIGDEVPYQYTVKIPADIDAYKNAYVFTFIDTMTEGLTFNNDVVVKVGDTTVEASMYEVLTGDAAKAVANDATFAIKTDDMRKHEFAGKTMTVTYSATLNKKAVIAGEGNKNEVRLRFSNNPNGSGEGETPKDTTVVFTFQLDVNKVDQNKNPLAGAAFTLYKKVAADVKGAVSLDADGKEVAEGTDKYVKVGTQEAVENGANYTGSFKGIDDGEYVLVETTTPAGYNTAAPIKFTLAADHTKAPVELTVTGVDKTETGAATTVINNAGSILPSTGGIGTTIFYVIGGILIVGGGVMLFVRNKASKEEK